MLAEALDPAGYLVTAHSMGSWIVGALAAVLGIAVLIRERGSRVSLALCLLTTSISVWLLSAGTLYAALPEPLALFWARAANSGVVFIPSLVFVFTLTVVQRFDEFRALARASLAVSGLFCLSVLLTDRFLSGLYRYSWGHYSRYGPLGVLFLVFLVSLLLGSLYLLWAELGRSSPGTRRQRVKILMAAFAVGYLGIVDYAGTYGIAVYPLGFVAILGFVLLMTGGVWRLRLLEITPALAAEQIIEAMGDALLVLDQDGIVRVANEAAAQLVGHSTEDLIAKPVFETLGDFLGQGTVEAMAATALRGYEIRYRSPEGQVRTLEVTGSVTRDRAGHPLALVFILRDITARVKLEEQAREAHKLEDMGRLAGEIARELELIVAAMSGQPLPAGRDRSMGVSTTIEGMRRATDRTRELTGQLLAFSASQRIKPILLDLNALIANLRDTLRWMLGKDTEVTTILDPALGWVMADPAQIEQVIMKLASNARDATAVDGVLTIETRNVRLPGFAPPLHGRVRPGQYAMLAVSAPGWVMDDDTRRHLFEPSFARGRHGRVTGLDLAMVYGIVKQSEGYIQVESTPDGGTTFRMYFPLLGGASSGGHSPAAPVVVLDREPRVADMTSPVSGMR